MHTYLVLLIQPTNSSIAEVTVRAKDERTYSSLVRLNSQHEFGRTGHDFLTDDALNI